MKTHYDPHPHGEESEEQAVCGTWLGGESNLSDDWSGVDCQRCLNGKGKIEAAIADEEAFIVEQMGHMAAHMREKH
ncbi:hypothetical protein ACNFBR_10755 [Pseudomonas sp. NY11955]|uniref:hypothetical protein n=1 Tax=Pseudomonas sp. NY11955 TaxID=3400363 RepID=UPI003A87A79F